MSYDVTIELFKNDEKMLVITRVSDDYKAHVVPEEGVTQKELSELLILGICEMAQKLGGGKFTVVVKEGN